MEKSEQRSALEVDTKPTIDPAVYGAKTWTEKLALMTNNHAGGPVLLRDHGNGGSAASHDEHDDTPAALYGGSATPDPYHGMESQPSTAKKGKGPVDLKDRRNDTASPANSIGFINYSDSKSDTEVASDTEQPKNKGGRPVGPPRGAEAGGSKVVPTPGSRAQRLPVALSAGQTMGMEALNQVIRSITLNSRDKLKRLQVMCSCAEGWLVRHCLVDNGWNQKRNRIEGLPCWAEAVHRLTISLSAIAAGKKLPKSLEFESVETNMVYMQHDGANAYTACACMDASATWLRQLLTPSANILKLDLSASENLQLVGKGIRALLDPLFKGTRVKELNVSGHPLQDAGARSMSELLIHPSCSLESLDASDCLFWTVGCVKILEASLVSPTLRHLSLAKNDVGTPGALIVARLLKQDWGLTTLDLSHVRCSVQGMQAIAEALPHNNRMLSLNLDGNDPGYAEESWRTVIETHRFLQTLTLPRPVAAVDSMMLEQAALQRVEPILPPVDWQLTIAMSCHMRLGADSALHQLPESLVQTIVQLSSSPFELRLFPEAEEAAA